MGGPVPESAAHREPRFLETFLTWFLIGVPVDMILHRNLLSVSFSTGLLTVILRSLIDALMYTPIVLLLGRLGRWVPPSGSGR